MQLESGYRFCNAPRFHLAPPWAQRLRVNRGMVRTADCWQPDDAWRPATEAELRVLLGEGLSEPPLWEKAVAAFVIPAHLRARWWEVAAAGEEEDPNLEPFARAFAEFAQFKRLPLPPRCSFSVLVTPPGQPASLSEAASRPRRAAAGVNLGDERTAVVVCNLVPDACPGGVTEFLQACPDYLLLRVWLEPGEGLWFPAGGVAWAACTRDKTELDIWLNVRAAGE
jgi:hypothetical protein